jgi:hypothetical protein
LLHLLHTHHVLHRHHTHAHGCTLWRAPCDIELERALARRPRCDQHVGAPCSSLYQHAVDGPYHIWVQVGWRVLSEASILEAVTIKIVDIVGED